MLLGIRSFQVPKLEAYILVFPNQLSPAKENI